MENEESVNQKFNDTLKTLTPNNANSILLVLGHPSDVLRRVGISDKPIRFYGNKLLKKARRHGYNVLDLKNLPKAISDPIAIFEGNRSGSFAILTEIKINNNNVLVITETGKGDADTYFNVITSAYPKDVNRLETWARDNKILYVNKEKAPDYLRAPSAPIAGAQDNQGLKTYSL